ncbi:MAG: SDR family NAD(P)-dependent oxidoreductase [Chloroflexota bacterium]
MADKTCIIIGAGPGISMAVARRFAAEGYSIALISRSSGKLKGYVQELLDAGFDAIGVAADAADPEKLTGAINSIGPASVLVYNAAAITQGLPSHLPPDDLVAHFCVNVVGALAAAQACLPAMREAGGGTILFTGGGLALYPVAQFSSLSIGKAGIRSLAKTLHDELKSDNIHVATVTVGGFVKAGTFFDPDKIAEVYMTLHQQPAGAWEWETVYAESQ